MLRHFLRVGSAAALALAAGLSAPSRADDASDAVGLLDAQKQGLVQIDARGQGEDHVRVQIRNATDRRLRVVIPAGLVAAASAGQGGFQSMGLGTPTASNGSFGRFAGSGTGVRSVDPRGDGGIAIPAGQDVAVSLPSVCLNFGIPTPTPRDRFKLVDVEDYTPDPRARKALRSLATLGTSQKVAQAVAWHVFNGMTLPQLATRAGGRFNGHELTIAARFIQALDASGASELVEPAYFQQNRVFVRLSADGPLGKDAARLAEELQSHTLLGLPIRVVDETPSEEAGPSALLVNVALTATSTDSTRGKLQLAYRAPDGTWRPLGQPAFQADRTAAELDGESLTRSLDRAIAGAFVGTKVVRKGNGTSTLRIDNRLPFTIASAAVRTTREADGGVIELGGLGLGPARWTTAVIPAAAGVVQQVELNGL